MMNKKVLTIAGSDSGGGAGIQADIKTMCAYDVYGMSVITAVTAQNTLGVQQVEELPPEIVAAQLSSVLEDVRPDAVKIGMIYSLENVRIIAEELDRWRLKNVVLDPVMVSTSGHELLRPEAVEAMQELLFPRVTLVTPNVPEAEKLVEFLKLPGKQAEGCLDIPAEVVKAEGRPDIPAEAVKAEGRPDIPAEAVKAEGRPDIPAEAVKAEESRSPAVWMEESAGRFAAHWHTAFLIKGGHLEGEPADCLHDGKAGVWFSGKRIETRHTHGTGCTLSAAIACGLAKGLPLAEAVREAKEYLSGCVQYHPGIGNGNGPLNHLWRLEKEASFGAAASGRSSETGKSEAFR